MANLQTQFCGLRFENPFVIAPSPASDRREKIEKAFSAGWGAVVYKTTTVTSKAPVLAESNMGGINFAGGRPFAFYNYDLTIEHGIDTVCEDIKYLKSKFPTKIIIGSISATSPDEWVYMTKMLEQAGADMIECSISCPQGDGKGVIPAADEKILADIIKCIKSNTTKNTPLIVKMTPNVTDIAYVAECAMNAGADAICAIDTVKSFIGLDIETGKPKLNVGGYSPIGGLSGPAIKPIALGCVARIAQKTNAPLGGIGGIMNWEDAVEFMMLGCTIVELCSALTKCGYEMIDKLKDGLSSYMDRKGIKSVNDIIGSSLGYIVDHSMLDASKKSICRVDYEKCIGCGACVPACQVGGFLGLTKGADNKPVIDEKVCRGCGSCASVCPRNALSMEVTE
jgi:dihydropyrimidine dehydrogenase (NAD+) subunit PreA